MTKPPYYCEAADYLDRARLCLDDPSPRFLFYSALELRCCVEARQNAYLEAQKRYRRSLPPRFRIGKQSKELNRIYHLEQVQKIDLVFADGFTLETKYVPVSNKLRKWAEQLGEFLHSQNEVVTQERGDEIRIFLEEVFVAAEECVSGNSLAPALQNQNSDGLLGTFQSVLIDEDATEMQRRFAIGAEVLARVSYSGLEYG